MRYTTFERVSKKIRTARDERVRFPDSSCLMSISKFSPNKREAVDILFDGRELLFDQEFEGRFQLRIVFTSNTAFDVFKEDDKSAKQQMYLSSGTISTNLDIPGIVLIPAGTISGTIVADSWISLSLDAHISIVSAEQYIEDAEILIDAILAQEGLSGNYIPAPDALALAATYLTCHNIYLDVFHWKKDDECCQHFLKNWYKQYQELLQAFINQQKRDDGGAPRASAFPTKMDQIGVPGIGPGLECRYDVIRGSAPTTSREMDKLFGGGDLSGDMTGD